MDSHLNRHTYGFIQSRLVPFYLHLGSACAFVNLTIYAVYHPSDMLDDREAFQVCFCVPRRHIEYRKCLLIRAIFSPPPDLHFLCVSDGGGHQRPVVWPNGVRDHGRHAPDRASVRTGPGHRPVVQPRSLCQAVRDGCQIQTPEQSPVALQTALLALQHLLHWLQLLQSVLHG